MIESNFEYTEGLLNKINTSTLKKWNLINEILMAIILAGSVVLFVTGNTAISIIGTVVFVLLATTLVLFNKAIARSNKILLNQQIKIVFNQNNMVMTSKLGDKQLYNATFEYSAIKKVVNKQGLSYVYFDKKSIIIIPQDSFKTFDEYKTAMELISNNYVV